jgi:hypothetical protein
MILDQQYRKIIIIIIKNWKMIGILILLLIDIMLDFDYNEKKIFRV